MLLACTLLGAHQATLAEPVWVEESWHHLNETLDCDGMPLIVDAEVLDLPVDATEQEFDVTSYTAAELRRKAEEFDWARLGCDMRHVTWYDDDGSRGFYDLGDHFGNGGGVRLTGTIEFCQTPQYYYHVHMSNSYEDFDNSYDALGSLSYQEMADHAQRIGNLRLSAGVAAPLSAIYRCAGHCGSLQAGRGDGLAGGSGRVSVHPVVLSGLFSRPAPVQRHHVQRLE